MDSRSMELYLGNFHACFGLGRCFQILLLRHLLVVGPAVALERLRSGLSIVKIGLRSVQPASIQIRRYYLDHYYHLDLVVMIMVVVAARSSTVIMILVAIVADLVEPCLPSSDSTVGAASAAATEASCSLQQQWEAIVALDWLLRHIP